MRMKQSRSAKQFSHQTPLYVQTNIITSQSRKQFSH
uniref:Uncharacterized protein n=1 Tax=Rhizophora mucronata TaxID=61149 RepID=A0A2P2PV18_RHIMU